MIKMNRFYLLFIGDSVTRQCVISFICSLKRSGLIVDFIDRKLGMLLSYSISYYVLTNMFTVYIIK